MGARYSLIIPVYKNEENIPDLLDAVSALHADLPEMEAVFVVDGSPDHSWELLRSALPERPFQSKLVLLSRNFGSFAAIRAGLEQAEGEFMAAMAADLQEPPDLIPQFFALMNAGECDVALGRRTGREDPPLSRFLSELYWKAYRKFIIPDLPAGGVDIFGCTRQVAESVLLLSEVNTSLVAQLFWVGYRRAEVPYVRRARAKGKSAWTLRKKFQYLLDSIFSFSDMPLLVLLWLGGVGVALSAFIGAVTLAAKLLGFIAVPGYTALILVILFASSIIMLSQGILGCYLWRCFENTKGRPLALVRHKEVFAPAERKSAPDKL